LLKWKSRSPVERDCGYASLFVAIVSSALVFGFGVCHKRRCNDYHFLTSFHRTDSFISERRLSVKTEVSIEYCVV